MTTQKSHVQRKVARTRTKKGAGRPLPVGVFGLAVERAGTKPSTETPEAGALTPEDRAALASLRGVSGRSSPVLEGVLKAYREEHATNDEVRGALIREALDFEHVAERLAPETETRDAMLAAALDVISAAEDIFYVDGEGGSSPDALMREALRSAEQELDLFSAMKESRGSDLHWQELWRASYRTKLAWKLAEFRAKHPKWSPMAETTEAEDSEPESVAS